MTANYVQPIHQFGKDKAAMPSYVTLSLACMATSQMHKPGEHVSLNN